MTQPLSPAAQAILNAYGRETGDIDCVWHPSELKGLAAALRVAVEQVLPKSSMYSYLEDYEFGTWDARNDARNEFLAIADELEDNND
jgi:hypothetical protein